MNILKLFLLSILLPFMATAQETDKAPNPEAIISTEYGDIGIILYDDTPEHKKNFLKLAKEDVYNGTLFHRVMKQFMAQGGDPNTKDPEKTALAGQGGPGYTLPAEISPNHFHLKGMVAAARMGDQTNPERRSSGSQFYLVQGKPCTDHDLNQAEQMITQDFVNKAQHEWLSKPENDWIRDTDWKALQETDPDSVANVNARLQAQIQKEVRVVHFKYPDEIREAYKTIGGSPHLDMKYTVFGEIVSGLDVLDKICAVETQAANRPVKDIRMTVKVVEKE